MQKRSSAPVWQPPTSGPGAVSRPGAGGSSRSAGQPAYRPGSGGARRSTELTDLSVLGLLATGSLMVDRARRAWAVGGRQMRFRLAAAGTAGLLVAGGVAGAAAMGGPSFLAAGAGGVGGPSAAATTQGTLQLPLLPPIPLPANLPDINLSGLIPNPNPVAPPAATPAVPAQPAVSTPPANNPDNAPASSIVADAASSHVPYFSSPGGSQVGTMSGSNVLGQTESFLVVGQQSGWYQVDLPIKPNGSTGWIRASDVTTRTDTWAIVVHQSQFKLNLYNNGQLVHDYTVAVGAPSTPTPNGSFYVLVSQAYNHAPYAVGIFGLSVFSDVLQDWAGGGEIGIHGWQDTSVLGHQASHGCVRMSGADFQTLYNDVPMGTPVQIDAN